MAKHTAKEAILDAVEAVVDAHGPVGLTLDAVALQAGVSKGGLMYHYPNKEALLSALVDRYVELFRFKLEQIKESLPDKPGREVLAFVLASSTAFANHKLPAALFAVQLHYPVLMEKIRDLRSRQFERMREDGIPPYRAMAVALAADSLLFMDAAGMAFIDEATRKLLVVELEKLINQK